MLSDDYEWFRLYVAVYSKHLDAYHNILDPLPGISVNISTLTQVRRRSPYQLDAQVPDQQLFPFAIIVSIRTLFRCVCVGCMPAIVIDRVEQEVDDGSRLCRRDRWIAANRLQVSVRLPVSYDEVFGVLLHSVEHNSVQRSNLFECRVSALDGCFPSITQTVALQAFGCA